MRLISPFEIKPFSRFIWVSQRAKEIWEPILKEISSFVHKLEIETVAEDLRQATWQTISEKKFISFSKEMAERGLIVLPVRYSKAFKGFAHRFEEARPGEPRNISCIVAKNIEIARKYIAAYLSGDHITQGDLLGYPRCCSEFFAKVWAKGYYDPIWQVAQNSIKLSSKPNRIRVKAHFLSNPILRYAGIRLSFHIPHSFHCERTIEIGQKYLDLAYKLDKEKATLLEALLRMPSSWDVNHGIAIVRTPIFYLITSSIPTAKRHVVEATGDFIPREAVPGLEFPFTEVKNVHFR